MRSHKKFPTAAALGLTLALGACAGDPDRAPEAQAVADTINVVFYHAKWQQIPATPENQVETIIFEHRVGFGPNAAVLDREGMEAVRYFLAEAKPESHQLINLSIAGGERGTARLDRLALLRLEAVRVALADLGYLSALATSEAGRVAPLSEGEVGLTVARSMAILPDCDQPQPLEPDPPEFNRGFGCSTTNNLGVMVANPSDLERGGPLGSADPEAAVLGIQRYRLGEITPLVEEDTKSQ